MIEKLSELSLSDLKVIQEFAFEMSICNAIEHAHWDNVQEAVEAEIAKKIVDIFGEVKK